MLNENHVKFVHNNSTEERELQVKTWENHWTKQQWSFFNHPTHCSASGITNSDKLLLCLEHCSALEISNQTCFLVLSSLYPLKIWYHKTENYKKTTHTIHGFYNAMLRKPKGGWPIVLSSCVLHNSKEPHAHQSPYEWMVSPGIAQCTTWAAIRGRS